LTKPQRRGSLTHVSDGALELARRLGPRPSRRPEQREAIRQECFRRLGEPAGDFVLSARAWFARGIP